tara:strand:- start:190 stop:1248 length:1059 start_codon:yes stop_codon:yes gene_type:complete
MGVFVDRYGARNVLIFVSICLGFSCIAFGAAMGVITLSLAFMVLRFFGQGSMMLGATNLVAQWFSEKRGVAMSILMLGFSASMAIHPKLGLWLIEQVGWREAWMWLGFATWVMMVPLLWILVYDKPEPLGLRPDGTPISTSESTQASAEISGLNLLQSIRTPAFWIVGAGLFTTAMLITTLFFFQVPIFDQQGLSAEVATDMFGVSALVMALSMPLIGRTLDQTNPKYVFALTLILLAVCLAGITLVTTQMTAVIYALCFGVLTGTNMTLFGFMWAHYFGRKHLGSIQGVGQALGVIGASLGPLPLGIAFDKYGSYTEALHFLAFMPIACAILALFLIRPSHDNLESSEVKI